MYNFFVDINFDTYRYILQCIIIVMAEADVGQYGHLPCMHIKAGSHIL